MPQSKFAHFLLHWLTHKIIRKQYLGGFPLLWVVLAACSGQDLAGPGTGPRVATEFETFYEQYGGERVFGLPITEAFQVNGGQQLQYFQAARFDYDAQVGQVVVFPLGMWELEGLTTYVPVTVEGDVSVRDFPASGQQVRGEFLTFYETYQAENWLGLPISSELEVEGQVVQYFENGRLEYHPELPANEHIQVSFLGQAHFDSEMSFVYRQLLLAQPVPSAGLSQVTVEAYVQAPTLYAGEEQTVYITVLTPEDRPVTGIHLEAVLVTTEQQMSLDLGSTDEQGQLITPLTVSLPPGEQIDLEIFAYADDGEILGSTRLTFKTWW